jgi:hypothetical protein
VFESTLSFKFFAYIVFDVLVIFTLLLHQHVLIFSGIYEKREVDQESVLEAIDRIARQKHKREFIEEHKAPDSPFKLHLNPIPESTGNLNEIIEESISTPKDELVEEIKETLNEEIKEEDTKDEAKDETNEEEEKKPNLCIKTFKYIAFENTYVQTLFPRLKVFLYTNNRQRNQE